MAQNPYGNPPQTPGQSGGPIYVAPTQGTAEYGAPSPLSAPQTPVDQSVPQVIPDAPPAPPAAPAMQAPAQPQYRPAPPYSAPRGLAITTLLLGIGSILFIWVPGLNILMLPASIAAIIFGIVALKKRQPRGMTIIGMILAALVLLVLVFGFIGVIVYMVSNPGIYM